ncbi:MAG TPA: head GIN domain-containing protein [Saprospiraceae bacterium]|nr:head GIN domain-containing protein [Saprospiraceae bacterium]
MKTKWTWILALAILMAFSRCERDFGPVISSAVPVSGFTGIKLQGSADVYLTQGSYFEVIIEGPEEAVSHYDFYLRGGDLIIDQHGWGGGSRTRIYVTMPDVEYLAIHSSGTIISENTIKSNSALRLDVYGSGDLDLGLDAREVRLQIDASGDVYLEGYADRQRAILYGSGNYHGYLLSTDNSTVGIHGSGNAEVYAFHQLDAVIRGSGNIYYQGFPYVYYDITGSGDLYDMN